jgi:aspartate carbamoyltransferase catalytic subunit
MQEHFPRTGLLSIDDLDREQILGLLDRAEHLRTHRPFPQSLTGKLVGLLFFEPSTRTRVGFHAAVVRLGGAAAEVGSLKYQPGMDSPESLEDTVRVLSAYCDLLVLRHPDAATVQCAIEAASVPVINAGAGAESHPTQTLIDLFAIRRRLGTLEGLRIGIAGDLAGSRSAKSLVRALRHFRPAELRLMAPAGRELPAACLVGLGDVRIQTFHQLNPAGLNVIYIAGCPGGNGLDSSPMSVRAPLMLTPTAVREMCDDGIVLCPLPRVDEIARQVDLLPQAAYFAQSAEGLLVRMAVVDVLSGAARQC